MNPDVHAAEINPHQPRTQRSVLGIEVWEIIALALSAVLIVGVAIPNYFSALSVNRGQECSRRLGLIADCLQYLSLKNGTRPGEKICEALELNQALDLAQGALKVEGNLQYVPAFFRYGTEPDCSDGGDFYVNFYLGEDGKIIPPTCSRFHEIGEVYCIDHGMHFVDMTLVDGVLSDEPMEENPDINPVDEEASTDE